MSTDDPDITRVQAIVAELRAQELVNALRNATTGASHWRLEALNLLTLIEAGIPPRPLTIPDQQDEAA